MVSQWLQNAMRGYNLISLEKKELYSSLIQMPGSVFEKLIKLTLENLPDEILVGFDPNWNRPHLKKVDNLFSMYDNKKQLFSGEGYILGEPNLVNRGDSYSVHHLPEEWTDDFFAVDRGPRGGRFTHWLHTHPNAVAIPSGADADAAQYTDGIDMILGIQFTPEGFHPWFDEVEGQRRPLIDTKKGVIGVASTGHLIHGLEVIAYHRSGVGINVIFVDENNLPYGWNDFILEE
ncbi:MAG: hypothetical protein CMB64_04450 [Euryarchaeota archaeon]|nr:hypothetical protein [Euryarchaeota archaeon]